MKLFLFALISMIIATTNSFAETITYTKEKNSNEFQAYQNAVLDVLRDSKMSFISPDMTEDQKKVAANIEKNGGIVCTFYNKAKAVWALWNVDGVIKYSDSITVSDGVQPLLVFKRESGELTLTITTTSDYKNILSARVDFYASKYTNTGDLKNPKYATIWSHDPNAQCTLNRKQ